MSLARRVIALVGSISLCGCMTTREYPRCYLFRAPSPQEIASANEATGAVFTRIARTDRFTLAKDWAVLEATSARHRSMRKLWPELGCVNLRREPPYNSEPNDKWVVARCQEYLESVLDRTSTKAPTRPTEIAAKFDEFACH